MFVEVLGNPLNDQSAQCGANCVTSCASACVCTGTEEPRIVTRSVERIDILSYSDAETV